MAEVLSLGDARVKRRRPWAVLGLTIATLGIYHLYWWYQINREMRDYSASAGRPLGNRPWLSLLAIFPGGLLIVPAVWTLFETAGRIQDTQAIASGGSRERRISPGFTVVLGLLTSLVYVPFQTLYIQGWLNRCWDLAGRPTSGGPSLPPLRQPASL